MTVRILTGDCRDVLKTLPDESVHCVVTSPPYFGLRDYGTAQWEGGDAECDHSPEKRGGRFALPVSSKQASNTGSGTASKRECPCGATRTDNQIGLEPTPDAFVAELVAVFREVRRVLRADGTCWLNLGDSYAGSMKGSFKSDDAWNALQQRSKESGYSPGIRARTAYSRASMAPPGLKPKDLIGIPWRVAFALQADGWYLRQDIIWSKPNPMPESVTDRCTKAHEYLFLLSKSPRYYYDADAIAEPSERAGDIPGGGRPATNAIEHRAAFYRPENSVKPVAETRNRRSVWEVPTQPFSEAHFATFPPALIEPCIKAGTSEKGCCAKCGAPWGRQVERQAAEVLSAASEYGNGAGRNDGGRSMLVGAKSTTIGWSPSCACDAREHRLAPVIPCTVLDPFAGAGTTGLVADRLQRSAVLIELNASYAAMARDRIHGDAPLFSPIEPPAKAVGASPVRFDEGADGRYLPLD